MRYIVKYAGISFTGLVRENNEDNMLLNGRYLPEKNDGTEKIIYGSILSDKRISAAVFDGIGGGKAGEMASFTAASKLAVYSDYPVSLSEKIFHKHYLVNVSRKLNRDVCDATQKRQIRNAGTTYAGIFFNGRKLYCVNMGDSRIYEMKGGSFSQISKDHVMKDFRYTKNPLSQYLGIRDDAFVTEPYVVKLPVRSKQIFLLCTDGLTDMLSNDEIKGILGKDMEPMDKLGMFRDLVFQRGAIDNTTIIILQICN